jgi:hypothetical protein
MPAPFPVLPFDPASILLSLKCDATRKLRPPMHSLLRVHLQSRPLGQWIQLWFLWKPVARTVLLSYTSYPPCNVTNIYGRLKPCLYVNESMILQRRSVIYIFQFVKHQERVQYDQKTNENEHAIRMQVKR